VLGEVMDEVLLWFLFLRKAFILWALMVCEWLLSRVILELVW
jgi:hypothetical protein